MYGFDVEEESITRCRARFRNSERVHLSNSSFGSYKFPKASLIVADASLFFCPKPEFPEGWEKMYESLDPDGIFCGSFPGPVDMMAGLEYSPQDFWSEVAVFVEEEVRVLFSPYEILRFNTHKSAGTAPGGGQHNWHIFSVTAKKSRSSGVKVVAGRTSTGSVSG